MTQTRLARHASAVRGLFVLQGVLGLIRTGCTIACAVLISQSIVGAIAGRPPREIFGMIGWLVAVVAARAAATWAMDSVAAHAAASVKSRLRRQLMAAVQHLGPAGSAHRNSAWVSTVMGPGLDALDGYFMRYLPQLILTALATPAIVIVLAGCDLTTGIIVLVTLPLIPLFMVLIGIATRAVQQAQWRGLTTLSTAFLDLVEGLATLKVFGREWRQAARIRELTEQYRAQTMRVVRVSFLSGFVLELIASLSVAIVAVSVGLRLLDGSLPLSVGLFVLLLAPEAYLPIRLVGVNYHAAADGIAAAEDVFVILDDAAVDDAAPEHPNAAAASPEVGIGSPPSAALTFSNAAVSRDGRALFNDVNATLRPGTFTAITGPSGAGKTSLFHAILGFVDADGRIEFGGRALDDMPPPDRMSLLAWAGQDAGLIAGSVAFNVALGEERPSIVDVVRCLKRVGLSSIGTEARLGVAGSGLSGGQSQRVALARCLYRAERRDTPIVLVDEPTSALDDRHERQVIAALRAEADAGRIVVVISHRAAVIAAADRVIDLEKLPVLEPSS